MRTIVLGDIHGHESWKYILEKEKDKFDKCIFLGDYFDNFSNTLGQLQANNFREILKLKKDSPDKYILLYGNHDHSYYGEDHCSGYHRENQSLYASIIKEGVENGLIDLIYVQDNTIFSHAGVSEYWMKRVAFKESLNELNFKDLHLSALDFNELFYDQSYSGNHIAQSPIWIRPQALLSQKMELTKDYIQIVGHTHIGKPENIEGWLWINDSLPDYYLEIIEGNINIVKND